MISKLYKFVETIRASAVPSEDLLDLQALNSYTQNRINASFSMCGAGCSQRVVWFLERCMGALDF